jgi:hypothetical protein
VSQLVQSLWIGGELSVLERLSMASFLKHNHPYHLYVYGPVRGVPEGVEIREAREILPEHSVFVSQGSYATFADWFRWRLLYLRGHYWVDTDVVCLRPFDLPEEIVFGHEEYDLPNVAVLKFPRAHPFPRHMAEVCAAPNRQLPYDPVTTRLVKLVRRYLLGNRMSWQGWGETGGGEGFRSALKHFGLYHLGKPYTYFYPIHYDHWPYIFTSALKDDLRLFADTYALHLWNDGLKRRGFDRTARFPEDSLFEQLKRRYLG